MLGVRPSLEERVHWIYIYTSVFEKRGIGGGKTGVTSMNSRLQPLREEGDHMFSNDLAVYVYFFPKKRG